MKPEITVIIPVYNVRNYLKPCAESVLQQTGMKGRLEILLIDDGSTDGSGKLCDDLKSQYPILKVIHQKNAGLGAARNTGIRHASGDYLLFVDADDFIRRDSLCVFPKHIKKYPADIYFLNSMKYFPNGTTAPLNDMQLKKINQLYQKNAGRRETQQRGSQTYKQKCMRLLAGLSKYPGSACDKLVRRIMILKHNLYFEENVFCEDLIWVLKCILYADSCRFIADEYYYYRQGRPDSITARHNEKKIRDLSHAIGQGIALSNMQPFSRFQKEIFSMMAYETEILLLLFGMLTRNKQKQESARIQRFLWLLKYRNTRRTRLIRLMLRFLGIHRTAVLLKLAYQQKQPGCCRANQTMERKNERD